MRQPLIHPQDLHFCPVHEAVLELEFTKVSNHAAIFSLQCYAVLFNYASLVFFFQVLGFFSIKLKRNESETKKGMYS